MRKTFKERLEDERTEGYNQGYYDARKQAEKEKQEYLLRHQAMNAAVQLMQEASKMMSRAGYMIDKLNGVK